MLIPAGHVLRRGPPSRQLPVPIHISELYKRRLERPYLIFTAAGPIIGDRPEPDTAWGQIPAFGDEPGAVGEAGTDRGGRLR